MSEESSAPKKSEENAYEHKIKEEAYRLEKDYSEAKKKYLFSLYTGIILLVVAIVFVLSIHQKTRQLEETEKQQHQDWLKAHEIKMKRWARDNAQ